MSKDNKSSKLSDILKNLTKEKIIDDVNKEKEKSYDIGDIFRQMELDLISNMRKTFKFHEREEDKEGFKWEQWQRAKLRAINEYRKRNKNIVNSYTGKIIKNADEQLGRNYKSGENNFINLAKKIVKKIKSYFGHIEVEINVPKGIKEQQQVRNYIDVMLGHKVSIPEDNSFFKLNDKKLEALQEVVRNDLKKAQASVLRKMDDVYRQTIFKSHVYLQSGATTVYKAVDMASKDFLDKGIDSITYSNGTKVNIASYAEMCLRTANHRATLLGEGKKRDEWGIHLVVVSAHANTCKFCAPWQGKVLIDDVFSHPNVEYIQEYSKKYPLLSEAVKAGLLHPNCRHTLITYFEGITNLPVVPDTEEALKTYEAEQKQRAMERAIRKQKRIIAGTCDEENLINEQRKLKVLEKELRDFLKEHQELRRAPERETLRDGTDIKVHAEELKQNAINAKIKETRDYIKSDNQPLTIEAGKQGKHILGHNNYIDGRSYLTISLEEAQELVNKYAGTGSLEFNKNGEWNKHEIINTDKEIGVSIDPITGEKISTKSFKIHYSKKGTHIVPRKEE